MTVWMARAAAVVVTVLGAWALATLSALPMPGDPPAHALLRLDWRVRGDEAGDCLRPTAEDLAKLPPHMQNPDACLGALPPYRLRLWIDGAVVLDQEVRGGGARADRPLTVYRDVTLEPGAHHIRAAFERTDPAGQTGARPAVSLQAEADVTMEPGRVLLVVRRQDTGLLVIRPPGP
jgi:hypothetical protein